MYKRVKMLTVMMIDKCYDEDNCIEAIFQYNMSNCNVYLMSFSREFFVQKLIHQKLLLRGFNLATNIRQTNPRFN